MEQGTIKKLISDKGFGFISDENKDLFFHRSSVEDANFEDLREGQSVEFTRGEGPKGPCAESVKPAWLNYPPQQTADPSVFVSEVETTR